MHIWSGLKLLKCKLRPLKRRFKSWEECSQPMDCQSKLYRTMAPNLHPRSSLSSWNEMVSNTSRAHPNTHPRMDWLSDLFRLLRGQCWKILDQDQFITNWQIFYWSIEVCLTLPPITLQASCFWNGSCVPGGTYWDLTVKFKEGWVRNSDHRNWTTIVIQPRESIELERL